MARPPFQNEHNYAVDQEVQRHDDAVNWFGEMAACMMLWNIIDFNIGLCSRCPTCFADDLAQAYGQGNKARCLTCYGSTFAGFRALIYRPAIFKTDDVTEEIRPRGQVSIVSARVQTTSDFMMRDGDFMVRSDGTRWRITQPVDTQISTGFGPHSDDVVRSTFQASLEDKSSIAFSIPVDLNTMNTVGWKPYMVYPAVVDIVNGPLLYTWDQDDSQWDIANWNNFTWSP